MAHPDLPSEQLHLDRAREALAGMVARTSSALTDATAAATEADSEVARFHLRRRLESLDLRHANLAFGRIDDADHVWRVGRRHIEDDDGEPVVVDWRAPVSVPFYRATVHEPLGLRSRRRYITDGTELVDLLEEDFTDPDAALVAGGIPDPLLAELDRERSASMRDIVATIAAEQDLVIRTPLARLLVVQGGPGTGKTAVALHRAAFLLFEHRLELMESGVLVLGPNEVFLRYVADVLPSLGETSVRQTTIGGLRSASVRRAPVDDDDATAAVKGDARMAEVIRRLVESTVTLPSEPFVAHAAWGTIRWSVEDAAAAVDEIRAREVPHATGREALRNLLLHRAYELHERVAEVPALKSNFLAAGRSDPSVKAAIDRMWPNVSAPALVHRLLTSDAVRRRVTAGTLDPHEARLLARALPRRLADVEFTDSEIPLVDEAEACINGPRATYGHVIVDEAQDLSAMAIRMIARRCPHGSMTLVGDLAQATRPWSQTSWDDVVGMIARPGTEVVRAELTVGYRTPGQILDFANRLLVVAAPEVTPARSVRVGQHPPRDRVVAESDVSAAVVDAVASAGPGTVAVVAEERAHVALGDAMSEAGIGWGVGTRGLGSVALLTPLLAKGLEFDEVVVVEPADIVEAEIAGHRSLFVALTRSTRVLTIVRSRALPPELGTVSEAIEGVDHDIDVI